MTVDPLACAPGGPFPAAFGACPVCGGRCFTCLRCGGRFHTRGRAGVVRSPDAPPDEPIAEGYAACGPCARIMECALWDMS